MKKIKGKITQTTWKERKLRVIGELLKRGFEIYTTLVDVRSIDCIIRTHVGYKKEFKWQI